MDLQIKMRKSVTFAYRVGQFFRPWHSAQPKVSQIVMLLDHLCYLGDSRSFFKPLNIQILDGFSLHEHFKLF